MAAPRRFPGEPTMTLILSLILSLAHADTTTTTATCGDAPVLTVSGTVTIEETAAGAHIPLGGLSIQGIEPDEIDVASACVPLIQLGPVSVTSIDPDEIDLALQDSGSLSLVFLDETEPAPQTREHVLLSRGGAPLTSTGHILLGRQGDPSGRFVEVTAV
jgi:hypothetical protein